ncbi:MAG: InlB B-repeat-containing protein [bacterium]
MKFKKMLTSLCLIVPTLMCIVYVVAGNDFSKNTITSDEKMYQIYLLASSSSLETPFTGTYEEWFESIKGTDGVDGADGVAIEVQVSGTKFQWKYVNDDDTKWNTFYDLSALQGADGEDGTNGEDGLSAFEIWETFNNGKTEEDFFMSLSAYGLWVAQQPDGADKSEEAFLASLVGDKGETGDTGAQGDKGDTGDAGQDGEDVAYAVWQIYVAYGYTGTFEEFLKANEDEDFTDFDFGFNTEYTVNFTDGSNQSSSTVINGNLVAKPADPTAEYGYEFTGWYSGDDEWLFDFYVVKSDLELVAKYELTTFTITYNLDGGINDFNNVNSYTLDTVESFTLTDPTKYGYKFTGWTLVNDDPFTGLSKDSLQDITLVATWEETVTSQTEYTVTYSVSGEEIAGYTTTVKHGEKLEKPQDLTSTQPGYEFVGWFIDGEQWVFNGYTVTSDLNLYAEFNRINYPVTYVLNGGSDNSANPSSYTVDDEITLVVATREGYRFDGWYNDTTKVTTLGGMTGDLVLTAQWTALTYNVNYVLDSTTTVSAAQYTYDSNYDFATSFNEKSNYDVVGIYLDANYTVEASTNLNEEISNNEITLFVKFSLIIRTKDGKNYVDFGLNDGSLIEWEILMNNAGMLTLVATDSVSSQVYASNGDSSFEFSDLNVWLNNEFYNSVFTVEEQAMMNTKQLSMSSNKINILTKDQFERFNLTNNGVWLIGDESVVYYISSSDTFAAADELGISRNVLPTITITL